MTLEDQLEEREVLASIFPDEITQHSDNSYSIAIGIDIPRQALTADGSNAAGYIQGKEETDDDDDGKEPTLLLTVSLPASYPTTAPSLSLTLPPSSPHPLPYLSLPTPDGPHLLTLLSPTITENLGTAMIYTLLLTLKDLTEGLILERATAVQEARDREKRMREEEEMRKFEGEKVSAGVFERWRAGFRREMMEEEEEGKRREEEKSGGKGGKREGGEGRRLTGREMWEKGLVGREEEAEEEGEGEGEVEDGERVVRGVEGLRV